MPRCRHWELQSLEWVSFVIIDIHFYCLPAEAGLLHAHNASLTNSLFFFFCPKVIEPTKNDREKKWEPLHAVSFRVSCLVFTKFQSWLLLLVLSANRGSLMKQLKQKWTEFARKKSLYFGIIPQIFYGQLFYLNRTGFELYVFSCMNCMIYSSTCF